MALKTPSKIIKDGLEIAGNDIAMAGRYASLQHSQQLVKNANQTALGGTMNPNKIKMQPSLNFSQTLTGAQTVVSSAHADALKMKVQLEPFGSVKDERKQS
jgi:hypothetical protein